ncbi:MAG: short chain dehydrogenase [Cyanobacteria bacterium DS2.3.42]|nr:short chain dehydrogenase [Cyanobacteria bacterium DS2.3.42]
MSRFRLTAKYPDKRAFITGAGSGLGLAFARALAGDGWTLGITDINQQRLEEAIEAVKASGGNPSGYKFDVGNYDEFELAVKQFGETYGGIDIGINNAGIGCGGLFEEVSIENFRKTIETDLMGVANGCHLFVPLMRQKGHGHILNVASAAAFVTAPRMSAYSTAKAGVVALSECLRSELSDANIIVSVLCPTYFRTNIGKDTIGSQNERKYSEILADSSPISADEVAQVALKSMAEEKLYIILPHDARFLWRLKRFMPERYWRLIKKITDKEIERLEAKIRA